MKEIVIEGPYFEDFIVGQFLEQAPAVTLTEGHATVHQMLFGDRLRLPLDHHLCEQVTSVKRPLINPSMVIGVAIGQTTYATQNVMGNLFYRGLVLKQAVYMGDTLSTQTKVVALRQNKAKTGRAATGMVALEITVTNQIGDEILHFWRCPMVPCRDPAAVTAHSDELDFIPSDITPEALINAVPNHWNLETYKAFINGPHFDDIAEGYHYIIKARDTITMAPELTRLTLNLAMTHTDANASVYGQRLVYGGHTISMAAAQMVRALPNVMTHLAWTHCNHTAPVFENDILRSEVIIKHKTSLAAGGGLVELQINVFAERAKTAPKSAKNTQVLDWGLVVLMA
ncbi:MAG: acyl dehydratase [Piscirickettsiaceae bacterium]|nr:MAG: acyl dehydratase [Piscirickettsiaceae bacterium]PCI67492.1 MAG: acyl dehydratase [Piscirickettsiaceae bacterium]